jgi:hypothetical protein
MTFTLQQFDVNGLKLYYGSNAPILPDGSVGVPSDPTPTQAAFLAVFVDGENVFAFYAPRPRSTGPTTCPSVTPSPWPACRSA